MQKSASETTANRTRMIVTVTLLCGLLLPVAVGIAARYRLEQMGVPVVSWSRGVQLMIPLALFFAVPFGALAYFLHRVLSRQDAGDPAQVRKSRYMAVGSILGTLVAAGWQMWGMLLYHGPGGMAEVVTMTLMMFPFTLPVLLIYCVVGAALGGMAGLVVWTMLGKPGGT